MLTVFIGSKLIVLSELVMRTLGAPLPLLEEKLYLTMVIPWELA